MGSARFSSPKTRPLPANPRECRRFSHTWKSHRRDRTGWPALKGFEPICVDFEPVYSHSIQPAVPTRLHAPRAASPKAYRLGEIEKFSDHVDGGHGRRVLGVLPNGCPNAAVRANAILGEIVEASATCSTCRNASRIMVAS